MALVSLLVFPAGEESHHARVTNPPNRFSLHTRGRALKNKAEFTALHFLSAILFQARGGYRFGISILTSRHTKGNPHIFPACAGLQINVVALLLAAHIISAQFHGAHTSQARASFPGRSLLGSTLCRVGTPREPEISGQEKAGAEGPTFVQGEGSQPAHRFFGQASGLSPLSCPKTGKSAIQTACKQ